MRRKAFSSKAFLVLGSVLFLLGLMVLIREGSVIGVLSLVLPNSESVEISGAAMELVGIVSVILAVMKVASDDFLSHMQKETQALRIGFDQTIERIDRLVTVHRASLLAAETRAVAASQSAARSTMAPLVPSNCRFCGARTEGNRFCPKCGKSQS